MHERLVRIGLAYLAISAVFVGAWAQFAPRSFYDDFPGTGSWVAPDGPFNEHLIRDVGALNLALAVVTAWAAVTMVRALVNAVLVGWLVYSVPHVLYHLFNLDPFESKDQVGITASLALVPVLAVVLLVLERSVPRDGAKMRASSPTSSPSSTSQSTVPTGRG